MDPTTSFVLALVAVVVAGVSAVASFIAVGQTARYHPKPYFRAEIAKSYLGGKEQPMFGFEVVNIGRAAASDVRLTVRTSIPGRIDEIWRRVELPPAEPVNDDISLVDGTADFAEGMWGVIAPKGAPRAMDLRVRLTWRQWPTIKRVRQITWRVTTDVSGAATIHTGRERGVLITTIQEIWDGVIDALTGVLDTFRRLF